MSFPPFRIEGQALRCEAFSLERYSDELSGHQLAAQPPGHEEDITSSSLSYTSSNLINSEDEGEEAIS